MLTITPISVRHRNTKVINVVLPGGNAWIEYDGFKRVVVQLDSDKLWWIVPDHPMDDDKCADIGPFDDPEEASLMMNISMKVEVK